MHDIHMKLNDTVVVYTVSYPSEAVVHIILIDGFHFDKVAVASVGIITIVVDESDVYAHHRPVNITAGAAASTIWNRVQNFHRNEAQQIRKTTADSTAFRIIKDTPAQTRDTCSFNVLAHA